MNIQMLVVDGEPDVAGATETPDMAWIANLSSFEISQMTCSELVQVIQAAELPVLRPQLECHLAFYNRATLERLAYLARHCCRYRSTFDGDGRFHAVD